MKLSPKTKLPIKLTKSRKMLKKIQNYYRITLDTEKVISGKFFDLGNILIAGGLISTFIGEPTLNNKHWGELLRSFIPLLLGLIIYGIAFKIATKKEQNND